MFNHVTVLHQHVSTASVTNIRVSYNKNKMNIIMKINAS